MKNVRRLIHTDTRVCIGCQTSVKVTNQTDADDPLIRPSRRWPRQSKQTDGWTRYKRSEALTCVMLLIIWIISSNGANRVTLSSTIFSMAAQWPDDSIFEPFDIFEET